MAEKVPFKNAIDIKDYFCILKIKIMDRILRTLCNIFTNFLFKMAYMTDCTNKLK